MERTSRGGERVWSGQILIPWDEEKLREILTQYDWRGIGVQKGPKQPLTLNNGTEQSKLICIPCICFNIAQNMSNFLLPAQQDLYSSILKSLDHGPIGPKFPEPCSSAWIWIPFQPIVAIKRDERDFSLETETETGLVPRLVLCFETTCQKSQYQSQNLRLISKVSDFGTLR